MRGSEKYYKDATIAVSDASGLVDKVHLTFENPWDVPAEEPDRLAILTTIGPPSESIDGSVAAFTMEAGY